MRIRRTQNMEHGTRTHKTWNMEHGTRNTEHNTRNMEHGTQNTKHGRRNVEHNTNCSINVLLIQPTSQFPPPSLFLSYLFLCNSFRTSHWSISTFPLSLSFSFTPLIPRTLFYSKLYSPKTFCRIIKRNSTKFHLD